MFGDRKHIIKLMNETGKSTITRAELRELCEKNDVKIPQWFTRDEKYKLQRGVFKIPQLNEEMETQSPESVTERNEVSTVQLKTPQVSENKKSHIQTLISSIEEQTIVPERYKNYVPFGNFDDLKSIIYSKKFYPVLITGPSGNGKSMSVEQACAQLGREFICYSMTPDSDEGDLLGGYVLINGEMVWRDGPVTIAAKRGAVLCIDEIDYGAQNLAALQRVLEGKPFLLKKKGEVVTPKEGFQIIATANTKGKGSEDGRYMYTNILNEAFLERFPITFEQSWPSATTEKRIIKNELELAGREDVEFATHLITWASTIRKAFDDEGTGEVISTRRLVHISRAYPIFGGDRMKAITYCLNRFDETTKKSFIDLYTKIDPSVVAPTENNQENVQQNTNSETPETYTV